MDRVHQPDIFLEKGVGFHGKCGISYANILILSGIGIRRIGFPNRGAKTALSAPTSRDHGKASGKRGADGIVILDRPASSPNRDHPGASFPGLSIDAWDVRRTGKVSAPTLPGPLPKPSSPLPHSPVRLFRLSQVGPGYSPPGSIPGPVSFAGPVGRHSVPIRQTGPLHRNVHQGRTHRPPISLGTGAFSCRPARSPRRTCPSA